MVKHGTVIGTYVKNNVISDSCKGKKSKNDVVGVQHVRVVSTKSASSGGRECGISVTKVKKPNPHTTYVPDDLVKHGTIASTDDNQNVISDGHKANYLKMK